MPSVYERVVEIVIDKLGVDASRVSEDSAFVDDLEADSLDLVEMIMAFEEAFSTPEAELNIPDEDAGNITTVRDAVQYLKDRGITDDAGE